MTYDKPIRRIAIVGAGVIGASWAAYYLARGFDVVATDPAPDAEANLRAYVDRAWPDLETLGLTPGASRDRLSFTANVADALANADFVQENGPERPEFKRKLFAEMDAATPKDSIIASSSSGLTMSSIQVDCANPERTVIGHPFNPPHVIPLVEVVGGAKTSPDAVARAMRFYAEVGKKPILLRKELPGHVANRLQTALYKEIMYLIQAGVLSVADADDAVSYGPGLRWGVMGPRRNGRLRARITDRSGSMRPAGRCPSTGPGGRVQAARHSTCDSRRTPNSPVISSCGSGSRSKRARMRTCSLRRRSSTVWVTMSASASMPSTRTGRLPLAGCARVTARSIRTFRRRGSQSILTTGRSR